MDYRAIHIFSIGTIDHQFQISIVNQNMLPFLNILRKVLVDSTDQRRRTDHWIRSNGDFITWIYFNSVIFNFTHSDFWTLQILKNA